MDNATKSQSKPIGFSTSSIKKAGQQGFFDHSVKENNPFFSSATLQPKLKIGEPDDKYEQQADRVADQVICMPAPQLQRKPMEEKEEKLQKKAEVHASGSGKSLASHKLSSQIKSRAGSGNSLPGAVQSEMEHKMGSDFSGVNIHTDKGSHQMNRQLNAKAFTHGSDIYFNKDQYNPGTSEGKHLLAHELVHVYQGCPKDLRRQTPNKKTKSAANKAAGKVEKNAKTIILAKLKSTLKSKFDIKAVIDGDKNWTMEDLREVIEAFKIVPAGDKKALRGIVLKRVISLEGKTAGRFSSQQSVSGTNVTNEAILELDNQAFQQGISENRLVIIHEVGHAVASLPYRTAVHAEHLAIAEYNRRIGASEPALEAFNEATDEFNDEVLPPYNDAVDEINAARESGDQERIAEAKENFETAREKYKKKKSEVARLKTAWKQEEKKVKAGEKMVTEREKKTQKTKISDADLRIIKNRATRDKRRHNARSRVADRKFAAEKENIKSESRVYVVAVREVSKSLKEFAEKSADQSVSENDVQTRVENIDEKIKARDSERKKLNETNENNAALNIYINLEQAQEAWFASTRAHALAHQRSARVQRFVEFVDKENITPRSIYPSHSYAEENWPHKPEEFYAEVYSMFVVKPNELKAKSKTLYDWFKGKKYL